MPKILITLVLIGAVAVAQVRAADTFTNVKLLVNVGDKGEEQEASLRFEDENLVVRLKAGTVLKTL
jgi:hypothetical protein